jgi:hypothetical protein
LKEESRKAEGRDSKDELRIMKEEVGSIAECGMRSAECGVGKKIRKEELGIKNWEGKAD